MKIALVHELLTMKGGAERVLKVLANAFPDAPVYTLLYDEKKLGDWFPKERVRTACNPLPATRCLLPARLRFNHHLHLSQFPRAVESWDFSEFDLVISSSSAFAHGIRTNGNTKHVCYVHSPARYLWDRTHDVQEQAGKGMLGSLKRAYLSRVFHKLRLWDASVANRADVLLAASQTVQRRCELYWRRESTVLHPPIDDVWFAPNPNPNPHPQSSFLIVSTLARYKRIDLAIQACNALRLPLQIVGEGPEAARLKSLAGPTVTFLGYREQAELKMLYQNARAVIIPGEEDFGLVPVEAMSQGCPVIAFGKGGVCETVTPGVTGEFFAEPTAESLQETITRFINNDQNMYAKETLKAAAAPFSATVFLTELRKHLPL